MGTTATDAPDSAVAGCGCTKISVDSHEYFYMSVTSCAKVSHCFMSHGRPGRRLGACQGERQSAAAAPPEGNSIDKLQRAPGPRGPGGSCFSKNLCDPLPGLWGHCPSFKSKPQNQIQREQHGQSNSGIPSGIQELTIHCLAGKKCN